MFAAAVGGLLTAAVGSSGTLAFNAATFVIVAALLGTAPALATPAPGEPDDGEPRGSARAAVAHAIRYVRDTRPLGLLLAADFSFTAFAMLVNPVEVVLVQGELHASSAALGLVLGGWGVGMIVGGALVSRARAALGELSVLALGAMAQAIAFLGMGLAGAIPEVVAFSAVGGVGNGLSAVLLVTVVQRHTADRLQVRVSSLMETLATAAIALAFAASGAVAAVAGVRVVYEIAGAGCLAVVALVALAFAATGRARPEPAVAVGV
jgi:predicted MFS family arabinose efflux permease